MSIRKLLTISFVFTIAAVMQAQQVVRMEYFIDTDPGHGKGHSISNLQLGDNQLTFEFGNAAPGPHVLGVRAQDSDGNWSQTISRTFLIADKMEAQDPVRIEYFLDTDPGYGKGRILNNIRIGGNELVFDVSDAEPGSHVLSVRSQDAAGRWSQTISRPFFIDRLQDIVYVEYFIDTDPGAGLGKPIALPDVAYKAHLTLEFEVNTVGLSAGQHVLYVRGLDALGQWTDIKEHPFTIFKQGGEELVSNGDLNRIEYFFDTDPGYGNGFSLEDPKTGENTYLMSFESINEGVHVLSLRAQDDVGHWSQTISRTIYAIKPVGNIVAVEYFFDSDPGKDKGNALNLPTDLSGSFAFEVPIDNLSAGIHQFYVRAKDSNGNWSVLRSAEVEVIDLSGINSVELNEKLHDIYDLQGRKLTPEMISKGGKAKRIYIIDGRKFVK